MARITFFNVRCFIKTASQKIELNQILGFGSFYPANEPYIIADFKLKINPIQEKVSLND
jgi:hypothetical protein